MTIVVVPLDQEVDEALGHLAAARGCSRAELAAAAVARFVLEERQAIDRVVEARLRQLDVLDGDRTQARRAFGRI